MARPIPDEPDLALRCAEFFVGRGGPADSLAISGDAASGFYVEFIHGGHCFPLPALSAADGDELLRFFLRLSRRASRARAVRRQGDSPSGVSGPAVP